MKSEQRLRMDAQFEAFVAIIEDLHNNFYIREDAMILLRVFEKKSETSGLYSEMESLALHHIVHELEDRFPILKIKS